MKPSHLAPAWLSNFIKCHQQVVLDDFHAASIKFRKKIDAAAAEKDIDVILDEGLKTAMNMFMINFARILRIEFSNSKISSSGEFPLALEFF